MTNKNKHITKDKKYKSGHFPSVLELLPHTYPKTYFAPRKLITKNRNATIVLAIPTVKREVSYLFDTLTSLFKALNLKESNSSSDFLIVIFISEVVFIKTFY